MITNEDFQINNLLDSVANKSIFEINNLTIKNTYPKLEQTIKRYKTKLEAASNEPADEIKDLLKTDNAMINIDSNAQSFTQTINLPNGDFYDITWSVNKAIKVVETYSLPPISFFTDVISDGIAPGAIDPERLKGAQNNHNPILVVRYPLLNTRTKMIVIDGNHRLMNKIQKGEKEIRGYFLDVEHQEKALAGERDRTLYKIHYNLGIIINYMVGDFSKSKLNKHLLNI